MEYVYITKSLHHLVCKTQHKQKNISLFHFYFTQDARIHFINQDAKQKQKEKNQHNMSTKICKFLTNNVYYINYIN